MHRSLILDFVGNYPGTTDAGLAELIAKESCVPLSQTFLVARADQTVLPQQLHGLGGVEILQNVSQPNKLVQIQPVIRILQRLRQNLAFGESVLVVSYSGQVLGIAGSDNNGQVHTKSFREFMSGALGEPRPSSEQRVYSQPWGRAGTSLQLMPAPSVIPKWAFDWFCPLDDAINALVTALSRGRFSSIERSVPDPNLRPLIAGVDPRFEGKGVMTGTQGMMTQLISAAQGRGVIDVARSHNGTKYIWVRSQNATDLQPLIQKPFPLEGPTPEQSTSAPNLAADALSNTEVAAAPAPILSSQVQVVEETFDYRSGHLQTTLHEAKFGPYSEGRLQMYKELAQVLSQKPGLACSHLIREAKTAAATEGKPAKTGQPQPWRKIADFVEQLLTMSGVLLDDSERPIGRGIRAKTASVYRLADSWQQKADAEIVLRLVDLVDNLGHDDHENLAGLLYLSRSQEACDKVEAILLYLVEDNRLCEEDIDGRLVYRRLSSGNQLRVVAKA
jgi:hypothetical protein